MSETRMMMKGDAMAEMQRAFMMLGFEDWAAGRLTKLCAESFHYDEVYKRARKIIEKLEKK